MMPSEVTELLRPLRAAYYTSVRNIALEIMADYPWPKNGEEDEHADTRDDAIAYRLDGTSWTTYTHSAAALLLVSDNDDAAEEMLGEEDAKGCTVEHRASLAMLADVRETIAAFAAHPNLLEAARKLAAGAGEARP